MAGWRTLGGLVVLFAAAAAQAQTVALKEAPLDGSYFRVKLHLDLTGELRVYQQDKVTPLKQTATADHEFLERVLKADDAAAAVRKSARYYTRAAADISTDGKPQRLALRNERRLSVAQCFSEQRLVYCLKGPWTRDELELAQHFDTLHLPGLLPGKDTAVGETWKVGNAAVQALCAFDGLTGQELTCKLEEVKDNVAVVSLAGTAEGIDLGSAVKLKISGRYRFDVLAGRIVALEWKQHDERDQGPASPGLAADLTVTLERKSVDAATELNDIILDGLCERESAAVPEGLGALWHRDGKGRYELTYAADWHTVAHDDDHLVLRLLDRGDFVAQATVTWWRKAEDGKHLTAAEFKDAMAEASGWEQEKVIVEPREEKSERGYWICHLEAEGRLQGLATRQHFYLVAGPQGEQVVIAFTLTPNQAQKLGTRDLKLVCEGLVFAEAKTP
jgi:hypothetical protein